MVRMGGSGRSTIEGCVFSKFRRWPGWTRLFARVDCRIGRGRRYNQYCLLIQSISESMLFTWHIILLHFMLNLASRHPHHCPARVPQPVSIILTEQLQCVCLQWCVVLEILCMSFLDWARLGDRARLYHLSLRNIISEQGFRTALNPDDLGVILSDSGVFESLSIRGLTQMCVHDIQTES